MEFVLLSSRSTDSAAHWSRALADAAAVALAASGAPVHWLCPIGRQESEPTPRPGVNLVTIRGRVPSVRRVQARVHDKVMDITLARLLRPLRRALVVHVGFGAPGSVTALWLAERMGAKAVAVVDAAEVLCPRQTLVHASGEGCSDFSDPQRCQQCVRGGVRRLTGEPVGASAGATKSVWRSPAALWPGSPGLHQLLTRSDLILAGLLPALVWTRSSVDRASLVDFGLSARNVRDASENDVFASGEVLARELLAHAR